MSLAFAPDSGGVNEAKSLAVDLDDLIDCITGRARDRRDDRPGSPGEPVQQR
jgi:hypothetical protein